MWQAKFPELKEKIVLVTGASRGIGRAIARAFGEQKSIVCINYSRSEQEAELLKKEITENGGKATIVGFDVSSFEEVQERVNEIVKNLGRIDILVNNAGITRDNLLMRMKEDDWDEVMSVNLKGVFNCTKSVIRHMLKQKYGRIINVSSVVGEMGNAGQANYSASKGGIIAFTKSIAREVGSRNITVNVVSPGYIKTGMTEQLPDDIKEKMIANIPQGRCGEPEEVASVVLFLASDGASYVNGQVIRVNGGMYT